ncbi:hypothetical protein HanHA300_Chr00c0999g0830701 [Helianthus annuus]|nr:hypothetical protein HanHA300_Chr00c0999g0830701 [Helianthus annuus]
MGTPETSREPCPDRILDDIGGAFGMVLLVCSLPLLERHLQLSKRRPLVGRGSSGADECSTRWRQFCERGSLELDNSRAATGGFLQMRQGLGAASRSAVFGGVLLAMIEGAGIMLNKLMSAPQNLPPLEETMPPNMGGAPPMDIFLINLK